MKAHERGGVDVSFPSFLSSSRGGKWSATSSSCFTLGKEAVSIERRAGRAPEPVWKFRIGKIPRPCQESNPGLASQ
jgi:hypothetical protein